jgi:hypothetical protein
MSIDTIMSAKTPANQNAEAINFTWKNYRLDTISISRAYCMKISIFVE